MTTPRARRPCGGLPSRLLLVAGTLLGSSGCFLFGGPDDDDGGDVVERCDMDRYGCDEGVVTPDLQCMLEDTLVAEIGVGPNDFVPLADGEAPSLYDGGGGFQGPGITHTVLAVRIENAALDRYSTIGAHFGIWEASACQPGPGGEPMPCSGEPEYGSRDVVLGSGPELAIAADGAVEEFGITFVSDFSIERETVAQVILEDPCGQTGFSQHAFGTP